MKLRFLKIAYQFLFLLSKTNIRYIITKKLLIGGLIVSMTMSCAVSKSSDKNNEETSTQEKQTEKVKKDKIKKRPGRRKHGGCYRF